MRQPQETQRRKMASKKINATPQGTWLGKVVSGSATQSLWLGDRKVGSQVVGEDQSRLPGRGAVRKVGRGGR